MTILGVNELQQASSRGFISSIEPSERKWTAVYKTWSKTKIMQ